MKSWISAIALFLVALPALAVDEDAVAKAVPQADTDPTAMILFALVFVGLIGAYAYVIWKAERKKKGAPK